MTECVGSFSTVSIQDKQNLMTQTWFFPAHLQAYDYIDAVESLRDQDVA